MTADLPLTRELQRILEQRDGDDGLPLQQFLLQRIAPLLASAHNEAATLLVAVLGTAPAEPLALAMLGECRALQNRPAEAERLLEQALRAAPRVEPARLRLAELYLLRGDQEAARELIEAQTGCAPALHRRWIHAAAACNAAVGWELRIDAEASAEVQSEQCLTALLNTSKGATGACAAALSALAAKRFPDSVCAPMLRVHLSSRLSLPTHYSDHAMLDASRNRYGAAITELERSWTRQRLATIEPALQQLSWSNFHLAYQGQNDRVLQSAYGDWLAMAARTLRPDLTRHPTLGTAARPRVGVVSGHWYACTAGWYFASWIDALAALPIDLEVVAVGPTEDAFTRSLRARGGRLVRVLGNADRIAEYLYQRRFDLLIYPEIGMHADLLPVAALRLAPQQWAAWGHPVTTGLPTIDRFITCTEMEPPDFADHYRETPLGLPGIGTRYAAPSAPPITVKEELGLPVAPIVLVPQSQFKVHVDNDAVYRELLDRHPTARLAFVVAGQPWECTLLRDRIVGSMSAQASGRLLFLPFMDRNLLLRVMSACDLMLDPLHWSGGNTALDALRAGLPIVTARGSFMRGRQSAAMLSRLGLDGDCVVNPAELAQRTTALLKGGALADTRALIHAGFDQLIDGAEACAKLADEVMEALANAPRGFAAGTSDER